MQEEIEEQEELLNESIATSIRGKRQAAAKTAPPAKRCTPFLARDGGWSPPRPAASTSVRVCLGATHVLAARSRQQAQHCRH